MWWQQTNQELRSLWLQLTMWLTVLLFIYWFKHGLWFYIKQMQLLFEISGSVTVNHLHWDFHPFCIAQQIHQDFEVPQTLNDQKNKRFLAHQANNPFLHHRCSLHSEIVKMSSVEENLMGPFASCWQKRNEQSVDKPHKIDNGSPRVKLTLFFETRFHVEIKLCLILFS